MDYTTYALYGIPVITLVIALVKVARDAGLPSKYAPVASIALGALGGVGVALQQGDPVVTGFVAGIVIGATACGIYDAGKVKSIN